MKCVLRAWGQLKRGFEEEVGCGNNWLDMMRFQYWFVVLGICPATARGNFHAIEG